jgi:dienelactone hydrolase
MGKSFDYKIGDQAFEGYSVQPKKMKGKMAPAVLVIHNWMGVTDETKKQSDKLAGLGFVVLAADVYGKGVRPKNADEAKKESGKYYADKKLLQQRLTAAFEELKKMKNVDTTKLLVVGYCFGGSSAVEFARTGADLKGVVSFHGGLNSAGPEEGKLIKAKIIAFHGADDPYVPAENLAKFEAEMRANKIDWQLHKFGGAVHSFTEVGAGNDNSKGAAYNALADRRSWIEMQQFFKEIL